MTRIERKSNFFDIQSVIGVIAVTILSETLIRALRGQEIDILDGKYRGRKIFPRFNDDGSVTVKSEAVGLLRVENKEVLLFDHTDQPTPIGVDVHIGRNTIRTSKGMFFMKSGRSYWIKKNETYNAIEGIEITHIQK